MATHTPIELASRSLIWEKYTAETAKLVCIQVVMKGLPSTLRRLEQKRPWNWQDAETIKKTKKKRVYGQGKKQQVMRSRQRQTWQCWHLVFFWHKESVCHSYSATSVLIVKQSALCCWHTEQGRVLYAAASPVKRWRDWGEWSSAAPQPITY